MQAQAEPIELSLEKQKQRAVSWFTQLRDDLCAALEALEQDPHAATDAHSPAPQNFQRKTWERPGGGGGEMSVLKGRVFEKAGVNISTVHGQFSEAFRAQIPGAETDGRFWASGISVVIHPRSPHVPAAHMNTRFIVTEKSWFGGGGDLTPVFPVEADTQAFHQAFKQACDRYDSRYYPDFKKACDDYFYLPHRKETRGVGGIFYDYHNTGDWQRDFAFTQEVGQTFKDIYCQLVAQNLGTPWTDEHKQKQLVKRGRYAEFNLLYDRGTQFGLKTDGNTEAILMSLPPEAKWP